MNILNEMRTEALKQINTHRNYNNVIKANKNIIKLITALESCMRQRDDEIEDRVSNNSMETIKSQYNQTLESYLVEE